MNDVELLRKAVACNVAQQPCNVQHKESVAVVETFKGETVWAGEVEVFGVDHPQTDTCYAWEQQDDPEPCVTVLGIKPIVSALHAVRAYLVGRFKA